jgi:hypothetical protein
VKGLVLCTVLLALTSPVLAEGSANFIIGQRTLPDEDLWNRHEDQPAFGARVSVAGEDWPVFLAIGAHYSYDKTSETFFGFGTVDFSGSVSEVSLGALKEWKMSHGFRPFVEGGIAAVAGHLAASGPGFHFSETDTAIGIYGAGGVYWRIGSRLNVGIDVRALRRAKIRIDEVRGEADYLQYGLLVGWGWD